MRRWLIALLLLVACGLAQGTAGSRSLGVVLLVDPSRVDADMAAIAALGFHWVRVLPDWTRQQPSANAFDWTTSDAVVRAARDHGLSLVYTLGYTPQWAARYPDGEPDVWRKNRTGDPAIWQGYVQALTTRYRNDVAAWQIWEQADVYHFRGSETDYFGLLDIPDPAVAVIAPEDGDLDVGDVNRLCHSTASFDAVGLVPRVEQPEQLMRPLQTLERQVVHEPVWITGLGWDVAPLAPYRRRPVVTETEQSAYLVRGMTLALAVHCDHVFWSTWRDEDQGPYELQSRSGLLRADGTERPAAQACRVLLQQLAGRHFVRSLDWGPHTWGVQFSDDLVIAWSDRDKVSLPSGPRVLDMNGKPVAQPVTLTAAPCYLLGPVLAPSPRQSPDPDFSQAAEVHADLSGAEATESGLYTNRYGQVAAHEVDVVQLDGATAWSTRVSDGEATIRFDVDDSWLYFGDGRWDVDVDVVVHRNASSLPCGFNLEYDAVQGDRFTPWQTVENGEGWTTCHFHLPDANFCDPYCDFRINAVGSRADLVVRSITVHKSAHPGYHL
ncbi:MAG: hypothetical protein ACYCW6_16995 [Candidatus Xenobia bacterium]